MKTLQEKYNAVLEGSFPKSQFVRDAKMEVPRFISPYNGFEDTVQILKNKGMLIEAKAETPEYDKPAPGYPLEALERGVDYELEKMGLMSNETVSEEDYAKAKKKAEKNLEKDVNHYLHLLSGDSKKVDKHDREVEVDQKKLFKGTVDPKGGKAEGNTDTFNAMKKANLNEQKALLKEEIVDVISTIKKKYPEVSNQDIKDFIKVHFKDIQAGADPVEEFDAYLDANPEILNQDLEESIQTSDIKEAVKKVIKHVLKENHQSLDLEVGRRIEGLLDQALKAKFLEAGKDLIEDLVKEDQFIKNDVVSHLANELNLHVPIRDLFKEGALNERVATLDNFISLIQDKAEDSGFDEEEEAMEVIEAIADHYGIKIQIGGFVGENVNENQDAIKFAQFIHAHGLKDKQIKDEEYLKDLYDNYKENK